MTKERLEELIKQKATIYTVYFNLIKVFEEELNECSWSVDKQGNLVEHYLDSSHVYKSYSLFETKEQAEWALKTVAERTERFEPPMWEEIENKYFFRFMLGEQFCDFCVCKSYHASWTNDIFVGSENGHTYFSTEATKENYIKACEMVRDLFKGESNVDH